MHLVEINWRPEPRTLRSFGYLCVAAFGLIGTWIFFRQSMLGTEFSAAGARTTGWVLWGLALLCAVLSLARPAALRPLYIGLTAISLPIGFVVSHLVLAFVFYVVLTPVALLFRLIGRDALHRRFEPQRPSYWIGRPAGTDVKRYFRQF